MINNGGANKGTSARFVIREHADVLIPAFPDPINLAGWLGALIHNTIAASGRNDDTFVFKWLEAAWDTEDMSAIRPSPDSLRSLEMKLLKSLTACIAAGGANALGIKRRTDLQMARTTKTGFLISGRHVLWMIKNHLCSKGKSSSFFGFDHLHQVVVNAKHDLEDFVGKWEVVVSNMPDKYQDPDFLRPILYKAINKEDELRPYITPYNMWSEGHEMKT